MDGDVKNSRSHKEVSIFATHGPRGFAYSCVLCVFHKWGAWGLK